VGLIGGDHSTPYGYIKALAESHSSFGILHIDAHCDLRVAYEGFKYSHASIMYNVMSTTPEVKQLAQVAIRDYCEDEIAYAESDSRIVQYPDHLLAERKFNGESWASICDSIIEGLPEKVYVSLDIDGLSSENCPNTGTPVAGGMTYNEVVFLLKRIHEKGRTIIGFDLTEVVPHGENSVDANVGARILFKLCGQAIVSHH
jgi:agmatinase